MSFTDDLKTGISPHKQRAQEVLAFLIEYLKNPVQAMRKLPDWDWPTLVVFYASAAAAFGALGGIVSLKITQVLVGLIFFPISSTIVAFAVAGFFYYTFFFFFQREIPLKTLFTIVVLALLPFLALHTFSGLVEPIQLLGFAITSVLLVVGLSENTHLDKRKITNLVGGLFLLYLVIWIASMINSRSETKHYKDMATPESVDTLKKEFDN